ncbi:hypothetical protein P168DRAFT_138319 [Aspergillus campestris IBT 28561]|uniref:Uncharacterized protein n=1 Tax=Aspergillus campestris (strain IBT 28561) TaxID=1392248 RepID=A0A2I1D4F7_ASPC2|nr:uncharacterized protein P168DRAFT_138319 [Aspergillus campestris IBT 28561]PKY04738.1 hypothetical protein P168DRAFT_138319 [Aspergillus campestris IBT 28561]
MGERMVVERGGFIYVSLLYVCMHAPPSISQAVNSGVPSNPANQPTNPTSSCYCEDTQNQASSKHQPRA